MHGQYYGVVSICVYMYVSASLSVCICAYMCVCGCKEFEGKSLLFTWIYGVILGRLYDFFIGVYVMVWIGGHRFSVCFTHMCQVFSNSNFLKNLKYTAHSC